MVPGSGKGRTEALMTGSTDECAVSVAKREWRAPSLTVLGDAATLTNAQALATNDGAGGSS
jgi:hypothetical protein